MDQNNRWDELFVRLNHSKFRSSFHLKPRDLMYIDEKGWETIERHARDFVLQRLSPAQPKNDGKQTPFRGHPVFVAQHATATCCRGCMERWHGIKKNTALTDGQVDFAVELIMEYIRREYNSKKSQK